MGRSKKHDQVPMHIIVPHTPIVMVIIIITKSLGYNQFFSPHSEGLIYVLAVRLLHINTLRDRMCQLLEISFFTNVFFGFKYRPSAIDITGIPVLTRKLQDCPLFHVSPFFKKIAPRPGVPPREIQFLVI